MTTAAIRLHSFTRWFAIPVIRVERCSPCVATASSTAAVRNASVMLSMSIVPSCRSAPGGGPATVVLAALCSTTQPIGASTSRAKRASPCRLSLPIACTVHCVPVIAASASG